MATTYGLNGNVGHDIMIGNDDAYRRLAEIASQHSNPKICNADTFLTITCDGRDISISHLT
ncbi:hypothetical protein LCGC14_2326130 [marine sediment metagenome]|uniref:Uncharacterized protein n=1 Tax=marine sediment metagenome TaxID=412755 RepID=A0A0F9CGE0_9ZZZZ